MAIIRASRPSFRNPQDKVAFAVHATFLAAGYVLNATGPTAFADDALTASSSDEVSNDGWNTFEDNYGFVYSNPDKVSKKVLLKCLVMNNALLVDALKHGSSTPVHHEINIADFVEENEGTNYSSQYKNFGKLVSIIDTEIVSKLSDAPKSSSSTKPSSSEGTRDENMPYSGPYDPSSIEGNRDNTQMPYDPSRFSSPFYPGIGHDDLYPGPGAGMYPSRDGFGVGGGSVVGPDHPMFGGIGTGIGGNRYPGGLLSGVPPGARFDPYGPPGVPGFEPNRFTRDPRGPRGGGGTHPDLQHFGSDDFI
jgi:proteasome inhibitor subunit 1 (PI31)